jgi:hypothetical protein
MGLPIVQILVGTLGQICYPLRGALVITPQVLMIIIMMIIIMMIIIMMIIIMMIIIMMIIIMMMIIGGIINILMY